MKKQVLLLIAILFFNQVFAEIWLPSILSDNMVLQQQSEVTIWGWTTSSSETISVYGSWDNKKFTTKANQGVWSLKLPTPKSGSIYSLTIEGHETIVINNVLIGEVWLASGQSNMQWSANSGIENAKEEIKNADYPEIRFFQVLRHKSTYPQDQTLGKWMVCTPETMQNFSAVAYFFGRKLHQDLSVPVGLINSSWGGTPVETWIDKDLIKKDSELSKAAKKIGDNPYRPKDPGVAYNAMIHPILNFNIAGVIWYQGESNRQNVPSYYESFPLLIDSWRKAFNKDFPFYFVQIAPFKYDNINGVDAAIVRDAQLKTMLTVPKTGMVVTNDIGNLENIHPINKQDVGKRLALWALAKDYGKTGLVYSGPVYKSMETKKRKIILNFDHADKGLTKKGKSLTEFYIAGEDQKFYPAKAKIVGNTVVVSAREVKEPKAVRFAFTNGALPNLFNKEGLPASAFRTDNWEIEVNQ
ncbi:sialate O-acetylesterase [Aureibaculum sp. 2210JD6-5]|uniref:sialate O-acetylesterase n=1 Tax=Aureibaculum sp. 2210JD6-5 TaxID=3103957 RepID=UPI002AAC7A08|nr:sialate O-acetylesterase [Aureibaculum sp. 2210JD6-5]MDY7393985.1 sialate O-acetylesterase [Aureibaculum sp. 2210JD6-5]